MLTLGWPWLLCLLPLPWLVSRLAPAATPRGAPRIPGAPVRIADEVALPRWPAPWWLLLAWLCLVLALTRPQLTGAPVALPAEGRDIVLAVDISGSMNEDDVQWNGRNTTRMNLVQKIAGEFLRGRVGDRVALVLFGETAHLYSPLSLDTATAADMLHEAEVGLAGQKTAIGDALAVALRHQLSASEAKDRVIVLLTDGESNAGEISPDKAAELAARANVRIHTIGFAGDPRRARGLFARLSRSGIDTAQLQRISKLSGGQAFIAHGGESLRAVYAELDKIEPLPVAEEFRLPPREYYWTLLLAALLLSLPALRRR